MCCDFERDTIRLSTAFYRFKPENTGNHPYSQGRSGLPCEFDADLW